MIATKVYAGLLVIAVIVSGFYIALYSPAQNRDAALKTFASEQELKEFMRSSLAYNPSYYGGAAKSLQAADASIAGESASDYSKTNIQVEGVDEADIVKNDGKYIYVISGQNISIIDAYPAENAQILSTIEIENPHQIFINGNKLIVFSSFREEVPVPNAGADPGAPAIVVDDRYYPYYYIQKTAIQIYDISDRTNPVLEKEFTADGNYYDSRMIENKFYVIINTYPNYYEEGFVVPDFGKVNGVPVYDTFPEIYYTDMPSSYYTFTNIVSFSTEGNFENDIFLFGNTRTLYVSQDNIYVAYQKQISYRLMEEKIIEAITPLLPPSVVNKIETYGVYSQEAETETGRWMNTLSDEEKRNFEIRAQERMQIVREEFQRETQKTVIHKISLDSVKYETTGEIPGQLLNQFSMDEHDGYFRAATTVQAFNSVVRGVAIPVSTGTLENTAVEAESIAPPERPQSSNNVYVLDSNLNIVGKAEDLAKGEQIYSARFMGNRLYLVTFKKVDPLFVIDLSTPQNPAVLGQLKITGYSNYLHPYDENHIIGIGKEAEAADGDFAWYQGVKLSLFDVSDVSDPIEISKYEIGDRGTESYALHDHKAFLFSKSRNLLVIPIQLAEVDEAKYGAEVPANAYGETVWQGAYVFSLDTENGFVLRGTVTHIEDPADFLRRGYYFGSGYAVKRSLYMNDVLYTVSNGMIKMNSLNNISEINKIELPVTDYYRFYPVF